MSHYVVTGHQAEEEFVKDEGAEVLVDELVFHLQTYLVVRDW